MSTPTNATIVSVKRGETRLGTPIKIVKLEDEYGAIVMDYIAHEHPYGQTRMNEYDRVRKGRRLSYLPDPNRITRVGALYPPVRTTPRKLSRTLRLLADALEAFA